MEAVAAADPPRRKGKTPRPRALPNEEVWRRLLAECADVHPFVMRWCDGDAGVAWHAMFSVGCLWIPGKGASFRSYVRSWSKLQAYRMHRGGGQKGRAQHMGYAILSEAQRVFGMQGAGQEGRELLLQDVVEDDERAPDFKPRSSRSSPGRSSGSRGASARFCAGGSSRAERWRRSRPSAASARSACVSSSRRGSGARVGSSRAGGPRRALLHPFGRVAHPLSASTGTGCGFPLSEIPRTLDYART